MTIVEIMNSNALKKSFCREYNLPITVYDEPYFTERLHALDPLFGCVSRFNIFCDELEHFANENKYFEYYDLVKTSIVDYINRQPDFIRFNQETYKSDSTYPKRDSYINENNGAGFISIDMIKADFSTLKHYSRDIFECDIWEEFVGGFTNFSHIKDSKYFRHTIMTSCNSKKQIQYRIKLMSELLDYLVGKFPELNIYSLDEDEILIKVEKKYNFSFDSFCKTIRSCPNGIGNLLRVNMFTLYKLDSIKGWQRNYSSISDYNPNEEYIEFKRCDEEVYHQIVKHYFGFEIENNDLVCCHNGELAMFLQPIKDPWEEYKNVLRENFDLE